MQRRLAAILATDIVGYSRLIREDEEGTLAAYQALRANLIAPTIATHNGRIVKLMGDGMLVEFSSVVDAVRAAVAFQQAMNAHNADVPEQQRFVFRTGINLGDVVVDGDDIQGDGVNVAARLEALAMPGQVYVSDSVFEQVRDRLDLGFEDLGAHEVKNIDRPVQAYRIVADGTASVSRSPVRWWRGAIAALLVLALIAGGATWWMQRPDFKPVDPADMVVQLPAGPSIAVLPFDYLGPDAASQGYLADGLAENIISTLARIPGTLVIARNSTFTYKNKATDVREVAENFGVRYVLEGSVQMSGETMRVTAQLVDGVDGRHIWTQVYDRTVADVFAVQDEITLSVAQAIFSKTISGSTLRHSGGTTNLEAWAAWVEGVQDLTRALPEPILRSVARFERAIELDPDFAAPYASLAHTHFFKVRYFLSRDPAASLEAAADLAQKALDLDPGEAAGYSALGMTRLLQRRADDAAAAVIAGAEAAPGSALMQASAAWVLTYVGRAQQALPYFERAKRIYVVPPWWLFGTETQALDDLGEFDAALTAVSIAASFSPPGVQAHFLAAEAHLHLALGNEAKARHALAEALEQYPNLSIQELRVWDVPYVEPELPERRYERLRRLGLPETPPSGN